MVKRFLILLSVALSGYTGASCSPEDVAEPTAPSESRNTSELSVAGPRYLQYGVPIPEDQVLTAIPEPYNPRKHGPPMRTTGIPNLVTDFGRSEPIPPRRRVSADEKPLGPPPVGEPRAMTAGYRINFTYGIYLTSDIQRNIVVPLPSVPADSIFLYTPSHFPFPTSCIEATYIHYRLYNSSTTQDRFGVWNWCAPEDEEGWELYENMESSTWRTKYVRSFQPPGGLPAEEATWLIMQYDPNYPGQNCWLAALYNFQYGYWDVRYSSCGTSQLQNEFAGWTYWESFDLNNTGSCPSLPGMGSWDILKATIAPAYWITPTWSDYFPWTFGEGTCFTSGAYTSPVPQHTVNSWHAHTPLHN